MDTLFQEIQSALKTAVPEAASIVEHVKTMKLWTAGVIGCEELNDDNRNSLCGNDKWGLLRESTINLIS